MKRERNLFDTDAKVIRAAPVEFKVDLRLVFLIIYSGVNEVVVGFGVLKQFCCRLFNLVKIRTADHDPQRRGATS